MSIHITTKIVMKYLYFEHYSKYVLFCYKCTCETVRKWWKIILFNIHLSFVVWVKILLLKFFSYNFLILIALSCVGTNVLQVVFIKKKYFLGGVGL